MIVINTANTLEGKVSDPLAPYPSQEHRDIAHALNNYHIPFVYKQPMLVIENGKRMIEMPMSAFRSTCRHFGYAE